MQKKIIIVFIVIVSFFSAYPFEGKEDKKNKVEKGEQLIMALVEYDFSALENKNISGITLYIDTKSMLTRLRFPNQYLPKETNKRYEFISEVGKRGKCSLNYKKNNIHSSETENLLSVLDLEKDPRGRESSVLQKYHFKSGNIINLGKITVKYIGGEAENGRINYQYSVNYNRKDSTMLTLLQQVYPEVYESHKSEIYDLYNEFEECIFYIVDNVSEDKRKLILQFLIDQPERITIAFKDLTNENKKAMTSTINKYTMKELHSFLYKSE